MKWHILEAIFSSVHLVSAAEDNGFELFFDRCDWAEVICDETSKKDNTIPFFHLHSLAIAGLGQ